MNKLGNQISPYLLQHKNNPVHWQAWTDEALAQAINEDKPIILSIGYAACHWCHVMEHESFESVEVAEIMNQYFVNIKVDREERPDIDQIYMESIQQMGLSGGWPLNVFLMPDQKPFYGGTFFPKSKWIQLLNSIKNAYQNHKEELQKSADGFQLSLNEQFLQSTSIDQFDHPKFIQELFVKINSSIDPYFGGINKAPKFPMPTLWNLLLASNALKNIPEKTSELLNLSLEKMASGGIFDHVDGGFSRYSVDSEWFCPHFEKMLYDNGQLISTYAKAYEIVKNPLYLEIIQKTISFHQTKMKSDNGLYFASMDADSEGEEGKYYVWNFQELNNILPYQLNESFYNDFSISQNGNWENGFNILFKRQGFLTEKYNDQINILNKVRSNRIAPNIDTKQILSWNAMFLIGLIDSYKVTNDEKILNEIKQLMKSIESNFVKNTNWLHQTLYSNEPIEAFLDDLSWISLAYLKWYFISLDATYLDKANQLMEHILENFLLEDSGLFSFASNKKSKLIANIPELVDTVIPSSNSIVVECLYYLGNLSNRPHYTILANGIMEKIISKAVQNPTYFSNWWRIILEFKWKKKLFIKCCNSSYKLDDIQTKFSQKGIEVYLKEEPFLNNSEQYIVCQGDHCFAPVNSWNELEALINNIT